MNRFLSCTLGLACLAQLGFISAAKAAAPPAGESVKNINYHFFSNAPVLVQGDADLYSNRYNPT